MPVVLTIFVTVAGLYSCFDNFSWVSTSSSSVPLLPNLPINAKVSVFVNDLINFEPQFFSNHSLPIIDKLVAKPTSPTATTICPLFISSSMKLSKPAVDYVYVSNIAASSTIPFPGFIITMWSRPPRRCNFWASTAGEPAAEVGITLTSFIVMEPPTSVEDEVAENA